MEHPITSMVLWENCNLAAFLLSHLKDIILLLFTDVFKCLLK